MQCYSQSSRSQGRQRRQGSEDLYGRKQENDDDAAHDAHDDDDDYLNPRVVQLAAIDIQVVIFSSN